MDETLTDEDKASIARRFIVHAPPGEFNEVFNDVRTLLNDDSLVRRSVSQNGRWRSNWSLTLSKRQPTCELTGVLKVQVHYFEDGNVQLVSSKDITETIQIQNEITAAKEIIRVIRQAEDNYQQAVNENYQAMSDSTFKALRRQLPITKAKIDWAKIIAYKIGSELKNS